MIQYGQALRFEVVPFRESQLRRSTRFAIDVQSLRGHGAVAALDDSQRGRQARTGLVQAHVDGRTAVNDGFQFIGSNVSAGLQISVLLQLRLQVGKLLLRFPDRRQGLPSVERLSERSEE